MTCDAEPDANGVTKCNEAYTTVGTISPISTSTSTSPTVSLTIATPNMKSSTVSPGEIAIANTNVIVEVSGAESYNLSLKVNNTSIVSNGTTLTAGNVASDNTWGYKWDNAGTYTAPNTTGKTLADNTTMPLDDNGEVSFTKTLTFGAKFGNDANAGTYSASGTLSLVATPRTSTVITLANLTEMQQLSLKEAADACTNTPYLKGQNYSAGHTLTDVRDGRKYKVRKLGDGKCWMTENLKISNYNGSNTGLRTDGRYLYPATTDLAGTSSYLLPASNISNFTTDNTKAAVYYNPFDTSSDATDTSKDTGYYTWCAATAGTCPTNPERGDNATSSICPKGWKLPAGVVDAGNNTSNDFYNLFNTMGLTSTLNPTTGISATWGSGDLTKVQGSPYNFAYTGYIYNGTFKNTGSNGCWWSRTSFPAIGNDYDHSTGAYALLINDSLIYPGNNGEFYYGSQYGRNTRRYGYAVRCVADTSSTSGGAATNPR